jgi:hypothetical protein
MNSQEIIFNRANAHEDFYGCGGGAGSEFDSEDNNNHLNIASHHLNDAEEDDDDEEDDVDYCPSGPAAIAATNAFKQRLITSRLGLNQTQSKPQTAKPQPMAVAANK